eukprot:Hpha_TRINITY_DN2248_c0_g1::TRINITY_DN2248_c0_g1_i1::g.25308::m.25308
MAVPPRRALESPEPFWERSSRPSNNSHPQRTQPSDREAARYSSSRSLNREEVAELARAIRDQRNASSRIASQLSDDTPRMGPHRMLLESFRSGRVSTDAGRVQSLLSASEAPTTLGPGSFSFAGRSQLGLSRSFARSQGTPDKSPQKVAPPPAERGSVLVARVPPAAVPAAAAAGGAAEDAAGETRALVCGPDASAVPGRSQEEEGSALAVAAVVPAPVEEAPATEAPATEAPATEAPATEA